MLFCENELVMRELPQRNTIYHLMFRIGHFSGCWINQNTNQRHFGVLGSGLRSLWGQRPFWRPTSCNLEPCFCWGFRKFGVRFVRHLYYFYTKVAKFTQKSRSFTQNSRSFTQKSRSWHKIHEVLHKRHDFGGNIGFLFLFWGFGG